MKIFTSIYVLVLWSLLLGCTPRDKEIATADQRLNPRNQTNQGGGVAAAVLGQISLGSYGVAGFMMEKEGEILQLLSAANLEKFQSKGAYFVEDSTETSFDTRMVFLVAQNYLLKSEIFSYGQSAGWDIVFFKKAQGDLKVFDHLSATLKNGTSSIATLKENTLNPNPRSVIMTESTASLQVTVLSDDSKQINYNASGQIVITVDGVTETLPTVIKLSLQVRTKDFQEENLSISGGRVDLSMARAIPFVVGITNQGEVTFRNGNCPAIIGSAAIDKPKKLAKFTDTNFSVAPGYNLTNSICGQRPVVDLSRILVYKTN